MPPSADELGGLKGFVALPLKLDHGNGATAAGFARHLLKPIRPADLFQAIEEIIPQSATD